LSLHQSASRLDLDFYVSLKVYRLKPSLRRRGTFAPGTTSATSPLIKKIFAIDHPMAIWQSIANASYSHFLGAT
jgi:hypothetical protein